MFQRVQQLIQVAAQHDKIELGTLHNAVIQCMQEYRDASTAANKRNWDAAKSGLQECLDRLWPVYFPSEEASVDPERFDQQKAARDYLLNKGYKVSAGKFSTDWNNGKVRVQRDGSVRRADLLEYATTLDLDRKKIANMEHLERRKAELEVQKLEQQVKKSDLENRKEDARWVRKEDAEIQTATLVGLLQDSLNHHLSQHQAQLLHACGGDHGRVAEFAQALEDVVAGAFNELANGRQFDVDIEEDEE
ncbi:hypothetical protein [Syntrophotalea acetylenica]|uniref:Uncharacterized protein n=1 Tax=Syntrophotalea acetylenica TaxID=29542 RepID=A0A1L3GDR2_SYNAC|nr:hypothetical protein [Syntrophotalea acetylenica]APG24092.1 hypothetical protein A7E75_02890 [Syntrophotalea acetylenica]APG44674.1 hypothetical protein A6070_11515 [Syntrophotalea acetylenica]